MRPKIILSVTLTLVLSAALAAAIAPGREAIDSTGLPQTRERTPELRPAEYRPLAETPASAPESPAPSAKLAPLQADFGTKIVYTADPEPGTTAYEIDCDARGGRFEECGSPCAPDAEACIDVCAYTCENIPQLW